ncbi:MAG: TonB-dependent receptor [Bacteroidales bacterium]|nr:TonB-dependent receptor [Bacteroidales bacterium]
MRGRAVIALAAVLSAPWCLQAQEADTLAAASVYSVQVFPVVRPSEEVYLPGVTAPPAQVADVLRRFIGVQVKDYGGVGGLKTVNVRSLGSEHVGVFLDGVQVDTAQNMQVDLGRFSVDGVGLISLYNGQKTRRLQTAKEYASGASVHLESERPLLVDKDGGRVRLRGGSFGTFNPSLQWDRELGPVLLRVSAEGLTSSGKYKFPFFDTTLVRENGDIRSLRLESALFGRLRRGEWRLRGYGYGSERGFPGPVIRRASGFPFSAERQADRNLFLQGGWQEDWTSRYATSVRFKYADDYIHYDTHPEKNPMALPYDLHYHQRSGYLSLAQSFVLADPWSVDLSTDVQRNALDSDAGQSVTPRRTVFTGALASRLAWERIRLAAHLVYQGAWDGFLTPEAGGWSRENTFRDAWMPSFSLYYAPFRWLEMDGFLKRSYRLPSFNDLYYSQMGNSALVPESAVQAGIDLRFRHASGPWSWEGRLSPYRNRVSDKIVAIPTSSQFRWTMLNIGRVDVTGVDIRAEGRFHRQDWRLEAVLRYSFQQALDHSDPDGGTYGNQIPYIPLHSGGCDLRAGWRDWSFSWDTVVTGERWSRTANTADYRIAPWTVTDASLSRTIRWPASGSRAKMPELEAGVVVRNVFDRPYQVVQGYPMPGRSLMLSVTYSW